MDLKEWKNLKNLTHRQIAQDLSVDINTVSRWCNRILNPSPIKIKQIEEYTDNNVQFEDWYPSSFHFVKNKIIN